jgi:hypothetical protein
MSHDKQVKADPDSSPLLNVGGNITKKYGERFLAQVKAALDALCQTYGVEVSTVMFDVWCLALKDIRPDVLIAGFERAVKGQKNFMPTPGEFRVYCEEAAASMPKVDDPPVEKQRRANVLDEVRDIARELYKGYDKLNPAKDAKEIERICRKANIVRYLRMGIDPKWLPKPEVEEARKWV